MDASHTESFKKVVMAPASKAMNEVVGREYTSVRRKVLRDRLLLSRAGIEKNRGTECLAEFENPRPFFQNRG